MKRPLAIIGFTYLLVLVAANLLGLTVSLSLGVLFLLAFPIALCFPALRQAVIVPTVLFTACVACFSYGFSFLQVAAPVSALAGTRAAITGQITDEPQLEHGRYYYEVKVDSVEVENAPTGFALRLSSKTKWEAEPFDRVRVTVQFYTPSAGPSFYAEGKYICAYVMGEPELSEAQQQPFYARILQLRRDIRHAIQQLLSGEEGALITALLLGEKSSLAAETVKDFRNAGVSHLLAVSGLHLSAFSGLLLWLLKKLRLPRRLCSLGAMGGVVFFMALTGFSTSVKRAGVMMLVYLAGGLFRREPDGINSLGFSVLLLTLFNPFAALDCGLLLSFSATLGILVFQGKSARWAGPWVEKIHHGFIRKWCYRFADSITLSLAANLFTMPVLLLTFGELSLVSLPANLLAVFPATAAMLCGGMAAALSAAGWFSFLQYPFGLVAGLLVKYVLWCVKTLANLPFATVAANQPYLLLWMGGTFLLLGVSVLLLRNLRKLRLTVWLSCVTLLVGMLSFQILNDNVTTVAVLDVGNGTCIAVTNRGRGILIGCGGETLPANAASSYFQSMGVRQLDLCILPRLAETETSGIAELLDQYTCDCLILPDQMATQPFLDAQRRLKAYRPICNNRTSTQLWGDVQIETDTLDDAACVYIRAKDTTFLLSLYPGADLHRLPEAWRAADVYICRGAPQSASMGIASQTIIISDNERGFMSAAAEQSRGVVALSTSGYGNLLLSTRGHGDISITRGG